MPTNYDPIAEKYQRAKHQPWRNHVECFTMTELIGDPTGLRVLDIGCGEGFYTRWVRQAGAASATGVDLSPGMIALARSQESEQRLGIEYEIGDARELPDLGQFDLVIAAYVLNYARTREELASMCSGIARSLKPGGRFVTANTNPMLDFTQAPNYRKYGFETHASQPWGEGSPIGFAFHLDDETFRIENYRLSRATHESVLTEAGLRDIRWSPPRVSRGGLRLADAEYWQDLIEHPPIIFLECVRGE
jgi:ubiquinone/menaquinone biosynthesis C-methylase UbiE